MIKVRKFWVKRNYVRKLVYDFLSFLPFRLWEQKSYRGYLVYSLFRLIRGGDKGKGSLIQEKLCKKISI